MKGDKNIILAIDDTDQNLNILVNILMDAGYEVIPVSSGKEAMESIPELPPDLILLDIMMPELDGYELCKILKKNEKTRDIPVIFLTARIETNDILNAFKVGAVDYITKPFRKEELLARVKTHLALRKSIEIEQQLIKLLEIENNRVSKELEEARTLQLAMLPKSIPELPGIEIAVYMKTAMEVGGDYYDFINTTEGNTIIVIGDATGHGVKSGNMVSIMKSLLSASTLHFNFPLHFEDWNRIIKQMKLGNLFMGLILAGFNGKKLFISSAGMPPIYIFHHDTKSIELVISRTMPLGVPINVPYFSIVKDLLPKDIIILMTDGYLEQFNNKQEMIEPDLFKNYILEAAELSPAGIIEFLMEKCKEWMNGSPQGDDITFIIIKIK
jgi:serine phosphatase RsbU (regulator of sigma subunit)